MDVVPLWRTWPARGWPLSAEEERRFRLELGMAGDFDRDELTFCLTMLRCGVTVEAACAFAPGLRLAAVAGAYDHINTLRRLAREAFHRVAANPRTFDDADLVQAGHLVAPFARQVAIAHASRHRDSSQKAEKLVETVTAGLQLVDAVTEQAHRVEKLLENTVSDSCATVGRLLVDPWRGGLWDHPLYLPRRVTDLSPFRVRDLLGERPGLPADAI